MQYRREIDGLRAVAVLPVILFHAGFSIFSGGYVGVDVFFVISGYLITSILVAELERGDFSIARFYERRARRILPALFVVMLACLPFAYIWMLTSQLEEFGNSVVAVVFFASNVLFWREEGYFAAAADLKPLLHTWSLAVEEQYYLLFPLFLSFMWRFGRSRVFWSVVVAACASLILSEFGWRRSPSANFYLAPTRAWELLAGSICAFLTVGKAQRASNLASAAGLALILFAIFAFDESTPFPSVYALVPVIGAVLIILFAGAETWVARLLSSRGFVGIGLISYSAYLWHQPLFAFARLRSLGEPAFAVMGLLAALAFLLAWATWYWIERPFRKRANPLFRARRNLFIASGVAGAAFVAIGLTVDNTRYFNSRFTEFERGTLAYLEYNKTDEFAAAYRYRSCFYGSENNSFTYYKKDICLQLDADKKNYLVIGDSHAAHLWHALAVSYPQYNFLQATASGCKPLLPVKGEKRCTDLIDFITADWLKGLQLDGIILSARWGHDELARIDDVARLNQTITALGKSAREVIVLGPTVEYEPHLPMLLVKMNEFTERNSRARSFVKQDVFAISNEIRAAAKDAGARYVDVASSLCSETDCLVLTPDKKPMAWDYGHFTAEGAAIVVKLIEPLGKVAP